MLYYLSLSLLLNFYLSSMFCDVDSIYYIQSTVSSVYVYMFSTPQGMFQKKEREEKSIYYSKRSSNTVMQLPYFML